MATIIVPDKNKVPKEALLLGDVTITQTDCNGVEYEVHGLLGNDLYYKLASGAVVPLKDAMASGDVQVASSSIALTQGGSTTVQEMADSLGAVQFQIADLQTKYNNL